MLTDLQKFFTSGLSSDYDYIFYQKRSHHTLNASIHNLWKCKCRGNDLQSETNVSFNNKY